MWNARSLFAAVFIAFGAWAACVFTLSSQAYASPRIDCPLRNEGYSIDSPLIDILLKPEATVALHQAAPHFSRLPPFLASTSAPSFASIVTPRSLSAMMSIPPDQLARADAALGAIRVTESDREARCARYDVERPNLEIPQARPRILLFEKMTGYRDGPSVDAAHTAFIDMAARRGWGIVATDRGGAITPDILRQFDAVIWNNVSGDVLTLRQRRALRRYVEQGGGFVAVHGSGGDPAYFWDWYVDNLIGARFIGHPMNPQFQEARIIVPGSPSSIGRDLAPGWTMTDEWYSFANNPRDRGATIIASLDESTYSPSGPAFGAANLRMGDHPIAWSRCVHNGRAFYSAIGHRPETYSDQHNVRLLEQAITWAMGAGQTLCRAGREAPRQ